MHGYALEVTLRFQASELDVRNWVVDFGSLKSLKGWLEDTFDHKLLVAEDDPELAAFRALESLHLVDLVIVPATGCEAFSRMIFEYAEGWLKDNGYSPRCQLVSVEVREHGANSSICRRRLQLTQLDTGPYEFQAGVTIGDVVRYKALSGSVKRAKIERWVESTIIATDIETGQEVVFDQSDFIEWKPNQDAARKT